MDVTDNETEINCEDESEEEESEKEQSEEEQKNEPMMSNFETPLGGPELHHSETFGAKSNTNEMDIYEMLQKESDELAAQ